MNSTTLRWIALLFTVMCSTNAFATHLAGADLTYTCLGGNQYQIELTWYRDCAGIAAPTTETINVRSVSRNVNQNLTASRVAGTGQEISVPCNNQQTRCQSASSTIPGIQKWVFRVNTTLQPANDWVISVRREARNTAITNVNLFTNSLGENCNPNSGCPAIYVENKINNLVAPCNSSPKFTNDPVLFICANQPFNFNQGAVDPDGDSLAYTLIEPRDKVNATLVYIPPFSYLNPISSNPPFAVSPTTGNITAFPTAQQISVFAVLVEEFRNGVRIGSVIRDLQVYTQACANTLPIASGVNGTINYSATACAGQPLTFTVNSVDTNATQNVTMTWNQGVQGATFTTTTSNRPVGTFSWTPTLANISPNPYTFTVTVRDNACPTNGVQIYSYSILVSGVQVSLGADYTQCASNYTITPTITNSNGGAFTYAWSTGATTPTLTVTNSGNYQVTVSDNTGCSGVDDINVTLLDFPNPQSIIADEVTVSCSNVPLTINASPGYLSYTWSNGTTTASIAPTTSGIYSVTVVTQNGCSGSDQINVTINPSPLIDLGPDRTVCGTNLTLGPRRPATNHSYVWNTGATSVPLFVTTSGNYALTVTNQFNCVATEDVNINFGTSSGIDVIPDVTNVCAGGSLTLTVPQNVINYTWSNGSTAATITVSSPGTISITGTDAFGCPLFDEGIVNFANPLSVDLDDFSICAGNEAVLDAGAGYTSYEWSTGDATQTIVVTTAGTYSVTVADAFGCEASGSVDVELFSNPQPDLGGAVSFCEGNSATLELVNQEYVNYEWSNGSSASTIIVDVAGIYTVTVTDFNGCTAQASVEVSVYNTPNPGLPQSIGLCAGASAILEPASGFDTYIWNTGETTPIIAVNVSGTYAVTVTDANGCTGTGETLVSISTAISLSFETTGECLDNAGNIDLTVTGGTEPYDYEWSGPEFFSGIQDLNGVIEGTYTVTVTDANACSAQGSATLVFNPIVVDAGDDTLSICQGGETQLNANGAQFYQWSPADGLSDATVANPVASPTATTTYIVTGSQQGASAIVNGNFEQGNTGFSSNYFYTTTNLVPERTYAVVSNPNPLHPNFQGNDHTTGNGFFMAVNGAVTPGQSVWCQRVLVQPNTNYLFSTWISTLVTNSPADLEFTINGQAIGAPIVAPAALFQWDQFFATWNSGSNLFADICIVNRNTTAGGNDFGLDDISFSPVCLANDTVTVVVNENPKPELGANDTICLGKTKLLDAGAEYDSYEWSNNSTGQTLAVTEDGIYSVTVTDIGGCEGSDTITVTFKQCCFPAGYNFFTVIDNSNNIITQDLVWNGKYYITEDVVVQNGATLDLTNVDAVFEEGVGMSFIDNSRVRANNSVFRTCDFHKTWKGFDFLDESSGAFNDCVIKNAELAMDVQTAAHLQIRNNEFYNFGSGIYFDNAGAGDYKGSTTENTFVSDENRPEYLDANGNVIVDIFSIKSFNTVFSGLISQNRFVNGSLNSGINLYGVYLNSSAVSATDNSFSNLYRAFDVTGNGGSITLENNKIENTLRSNADIYPIRVTDAASAPLLVEGNEITYASLASNSSNQAAVYVDNSSNIMFNQNTLKGFETGFRIGGASQFIEVKKNVINDMVSYGVYAMNSTNILIAANTLNNIGVAGIVAEDILSGLEVSKNSVDIGNYNGSVGIRVSASNPNFDAAAASVINNCVNNSSTALQFDAQVAGLTLPKIHNNYLYNYSSHGIWSINFTGEIGSCNNFPSEVGKNSFISNFLAPFGSAIDVRSDNATIFVSGNGPNLVISFPSVLVNTSCNTTATVSCGNQIGNNEGGGRLAGPLTQMLQFRSHIEQHYPLTLEADNYMLNHDFVSRISNSNNRFEISKTMLDILNENELPAEMNRLFETVVNNNLLSGNELQWFRVRYYNYINNFVAVSTMLNNIVAQNIDERDLLAITKIENALNVTGRSIRQLTSVEVEALKLIDNLDRTNASVARDLVQASQGEHDYRFEPLGKFEAEDNGNTQSIAVDDNFIRVYPNPANGQVTVGYLTNESAEDVTIRMTDLLGKIMWETSVEFNNGEVTLDVTGMANGPYFIYLFSSKDVIRHTKLIKF